MISEPAEATNTSRIPNFFRMPIQARIAALHERGLLTDADLRLLESGEHDPVNIGSSEELTVAELAEIVLEVTGSTSPLRCLPLPVDDPKRRCPDAARARELLGWSPSVALREGLGRTAEYFRSLAAPGLG